MNEAQEVKLRNTQVVQHARKTT